MLNKAYSKHEYDQLVQKIYGHMRETGEWGEFFPISIAQNAYNETLVGEYFPLSKEEVQKQGWFWRDSAEAEANPTKDSVPETITDVTENIVDEVFRCEASGKAYKVIAQEFALLKKLGLPVPKKAPAQRHADRVARRNPRFIWDRQCSKCSTAIRSSYAPDRPEIVYCEKCYLDALY